MRELGERERTWRRNGLMRVHDDYLVNPERILRIRKRDQSRNWEPVG